MVSWETGTPYNIMNRNELIDALKKHFKILELVCSHCYKTFGESAWLFLSTELLSTLFVLRNKVFNAPITINTWHNDGSLSQRGLRCNMCQLVKSKKKVYLSAHCLGKAIDFNVKNMSSQDVNVKIKQCLDLFEYPIRLESNTDGWTHVDCYVPYGSTNKLVEFKG